MWHLEPFSFDSVENPARKEEDNKPEEGQDSFIAFSFPTSIKIISLCEKQMKGGHTQVKAIIMIIPQLNRWVMWEGVYNRRGAHKNYSDS